MDEPYIDLAAQHETNFEFRECEMEFVLKIIGRIDIPTSSGVPNVATYVLKDTFKCLPHHLHHILNLVIRTSKFPDSWKKATVTPLPKGGDKSDVNNFRPISILPLPAKLMEKVLHKQLLEYLIEENLLSDNQDGFRPKRCTQDSIEKLTNNIYTALNKEKCTTAIFLDFRKAFDTLNHTILLRKLEKMGMETNSVA